MRSRKRRRARRISMVVAAARGSGHRSAGSGAGRDRRRATPTTQRSPPDDDRRLHARQRRHRARFGVAEQRPAHVADHLDAGQAAAQRIGDGLVPHRHAEDAADSVGAAGDGQARPAPATAMAAKPKATIATPQTVAASITARPWRWTRGVQRAGERWRPARRPPARRRAGRARGPPSRSRQRREQRQRHAEDHRDEVHDVGADQLLAAARVAEALDASRARLGGSASSRRRHRCASPRSRRASNA